MSVASMLAWGLRWLQDLIVCTLTRKPHWPLHR